jgi:hypothetical protein
MGTQTGKAGRVIGGNPELKLVLYAKNGKWSVQPIRNEPYTSIRPFAMFTYDYAAPSSCKSLHGLIAL